MASESLTDPGAHPEPSALAALRDIHLPDPIGWWPPAIGWVVLGVMLLLMCVGVASFLAHYWRNTRAKRKALVVLDSYREAYLKAGNTALTATRISELLKRVALVYYPRSRVAGLVGEQWLVFLNETSHQLDFHSVAALLIECPYRPSTEVDLLPLFHLAKQWIKQRSGRCLK